MAIDPLASRQIDLGKAGYFTVLPEPIPGNQVSVRGGFAFAGAHEVFDQRADQNSAGFAVVSGGTFKRYDLVHLDSVGAVAITQGNEVSSGAPEFDGAPGFNLGPALPDQALPLAYILVNETAGVIVEATDIFEIGGLNKIEFDLEGKRVDKGLFGSAPAGTTDIVTAMFAGEIASGGSDLGVVTAQPNNYVDLLDQKDDEIQHTTGARCYGRMTEAAGVWTLSYFYKDNTGIEQTMDPSTDATAVPTDVRLVGVRKIYSHDDPTRPMFDEAVSRVSDQLVGDIPLATTTVPGKVELATDGETAASVVVQGNDSRLVGVQGRANAGAVTGRQPTVRLIQGANVTIALAEAGGELQFTITAAAAPAASFDAKIIPSTTYQWAATNGVIGSGAFAFTPKLAIAIGAFRQGVTTVSHVTMGFSTPSNREACGQNAEGSSDGNDDSSTVAQGGIAGASNLGAIINYSWTQMTVLVQAFGIGNINLQPSVAATGRVALAVMG